MKRTALLTKKIFDYEKAMVVVSLIEPVLTLPQVYHLYSVRNALGLSLTSWVFYVFSTLAWLAWGLKHKLKPIYIPQFFWLAIEALMIIGIIRY